LDDGKEEKLCEDVLVGNKKCFVGFEVCGDNKYLMRKGSINISYPFPQKTLCMWVLDLRQHIPESSEDFVYLTIINPHTVISNSAKRLLKSLILQTS
jgi:hypothetical protein